MIDAEVSEADLAEAALAAAPTDADIGTVRGLARDMYALERDIERLEEELKLRKEELRVLTETTLPARMAQLSVASVGLDNGWQLELKPFSKCSIIEEKTPEALGWLRDNGAADLLQNTVTVTFGRSEDNMAALAMETLEAQGFAPSQKTNVHYQTLNAWVREELRNGRSIPPQYFKLYTGNVAKLKAPKNK